MTYKRWDIFCSVVDNYGDVGVAWRLARQLADEHAIVVRLFVDDRSALLRIAPCDAPGVEVRLWSGPSGALPAADSASTDAVIEAFGCGLPSSYMDALCAQARAAALGQPRISFGRAWIEGSHGLASRLPQRPLTRHFYFPGSRRVPEDCCASADCSRAVMPFAPTPVRARRRGARFKSMLQQPTPWHFRCSVTRIRHCLHCSMHGLSATRPYSASFLKVSRTPSLKRGQAACSVRVRHSAAGV